MLKTTTQRGIGGIFTGNVEKQANSFENQNRGFLSIYKKNINENQFESKIIKIKVKSYKSWE